MLFFRHKNVANTTFKSFLNVLSCWNASDAQKCILGSMAAHTLFNYENFWEYFLGTKTGIPISKMLWLYSWLRLNVHYILWTYRKSPKLSKKFYTQVWQWRKECCPGMVLLCYQFISFYLVILSYKIQGNLWSWW